ncbi:bifunctional 4-hydroxy-2-oxoglutarate aldolase/2-dehydro-3-deoxy-phosphogluconate aldolase [Bremerella sp. P1]|uniref:bifunctional 4-hydroxy-2-oxoglutarate aldolase/2-dehydro-3-deoxy-phosphogluconate aldolase n=1 Tax=Bremerella sp. P1 TaxID=3026424 RepID=UPI0023684F34|nr:bifunctional 4-hydroxy-2-oxoglutarate aldolase/2-dehydro-3-deoxy-phosphogluconate aldolase [Bremerella sp. P1]WDI43739.1 bifunctional 4-hydroxy-2-oxoglutarate aldolase/2-dehydro-3-deoxy-phosphogluconate aldolase [Bremerella sp. P1]
MSTSFNWQLFENRPLVGILRGFEWAQTQVAVESVATEGITTVEVTMNSPDALSQIRALSSDFSMQINVGAGTVCKAAQAEAAIESGASFLVTPTVTREVIQVALQADVPIFVGAITPTEILRALDFGATFIKIFPANALGPDYLKSVLGPFSKIRLMPTGGITTVNLPNYLSAGATAFGIGGPLFDKKQIADENWQWLRNQARLFVASYDEARAAAIQQV